MDPADLDELIACCQQIIEHRDQMAFDWAWAEGTTKEEREFTIVQSSPSLFTQQFTDAPFRAWAVSFGSALMGVPMRFWYDQLLAKPPHKGGTTYWHQDEGYWGRNLDDKGVTCWMPFHDVDEHNGCMRFIDGGHRDGVLEHRRPPGVQSDLLFCQPDEARAVACPIAKGSVTFHHSKMPHMAGPNTTDQWRRILTQHLRAAGARGEGDHYPWKITVNQFTGERFAPPSRPL